MIFKYEEITPKIRRPIIPILLRSETHFIIYHAIIDSGADNCIFSTDLATLLGIKLPSENKVSFTGVGRDKVVGYWKRITMKIGSVIYSTKVIFAEISDFGHGILGQKGFFDHFDITLSYNKQLIEINPLRASN